MKHFKRITSETDHPSLKNVVIMGRKTYLSIPNKFRPLPDRKNIVITENVNAKTEYNISDDVIIANSFKSALDSAYKYIDENKVLDDSNNLKQGKVFVIGGASLFEESIRHKECKTIYYTLIYNDFDCDTFMSEIPFHIYKEIESSDIIEENQCQFKFITYERQE